MRVLHVAKTTDGAAWAAKLAEVLAHHGVEVHVALPKLEGRCISYWQAAGAMLHEADVDLPVREPWRMNDVCRRARRLVEEVKPDVIHTHFVGNTLIVRWALGERHPVPRIYHVAGPLHLEHTVFRNMEILSAGEPDYWIGSSRCIIDHYRRAGIDNERLFLSYYGDKIDTAERKNAPGIRNLAYARPEDVIVGNISWMYPPKRYLGQRIGLKAHEDMIRALGMVVKHNPRVLGVFAGGGWGGAEWYERKLRKLAYEVAGDRIRFLGELPYSIAHDAWRGFDLAVHVPLSENCGGVVEPLLAGVPVIASEVGGLPEVILNGQTGWLVPPRDPRALADAIFAAITDPLKGREMAVRGQQLVRTMFDVRRTGKEVFQIYRHVLSLSDAAPQTFDSHRFVESTSRPIAEPRSVPVLSNETV